LRKSADYTTILQEFFNTIGGERPFPIYPACDAQGFESSHSLPEAATPGAALPLVGQRAEDYHGS
jgi:hypothetical protein